jgi:hypothetical protein
LFNRRGRRPWSSVNFPTTHDGFALNDGVEFALPHLAFGRRRRRVPLVRYRTRAAGRGRICAREQGYVVTGRSVPSLAAAGPGQSADELTKPIAALG